MLFHSTRNSEHRVGLSAAIAQGIAPDGGLFVPDSLPSFTPKDFDGLTEMADIAVKLIKPFAAGDAIESSLQDICRDAFNFPAPLVDLHGTPGPASVLELFHGPTSAFKDFGARFLAASMERIRANSKSPKKLSILVATSGDTGGAVAAAFHRRPWVEVGVLYPKGLVSQRQAQQLACWGDNIRTFRVSGTFDECQRMVKEAFMDTELNKTHELSSANSINVGRLLPQMVYYAKSSLELWRRTGRPANYIIPSGNLGNSMACIWARAMGLPIGEVILATNANRTIPDFLDSGDWKPRQSIATLASAMDVGNPSNMERLRALYDFANIKQQVTAISVDDSAIRARIQSDAQSLKQIWCPHTATAAEVYWHLPAAKQQSHWVLVSTAHPAKFNDIVEPLINTPVPVPPALARLLSLPQHQVDIEPTLAALKTSLQGAA
ncbi:MAG TPA: threonine synthase [Steroidobacteraceae bacterium]|nr:threonine synthase [Steroidobacteraceae bacterium]